MKEPNDYNMKPQLAIFQVALFVSICIHLLFVELDLQLDTNYTLLIPGIILFVYWGVSLPAIKNKFMAIGLLLIIIAIIISQYVGISGTQIQMEYLSFLAWFIIGIFSIFVLLLLFDRQLHIPHNHEKKSPPPYLVLFILLIILLASVWSDPPDDLLFLSSIFFIGGAKMLLFNYRRKFCSNRNYWIGLTGSILFFTATFIGGYTMAHQNQQDSDVGILALLLLLFYHGALMMIAVLAKKQNRLKTRAA